MQSQFYFIQKRKNTFDSEIRHQGTIDFNEYDETVRITDHITNETTNQTDYKNILVPMKIFFNLDKVMEKILL